MRGAGSLEDLLDRLGSLPDEHDQFWGWQWIDLTLFSTYRVDEGTAIEVAHRAWHENLRHFARWLEDPHGLSP